MDVFQHYLHEYGYAALFLVVLVEGFGFPAPGQTLLIAASVLAAHGKLNLAGVLVAAWSAAVCGNSIGYWIGQQGGRRLILRYGRYVRIGRIQLRRMEVSFTRYGMWFVSFARFFEVLRQLNGVVAGTSGMPFGKFTFANMLGAALWTGVWGLASWSLGRDIRGYEDIFEKTGMIFVLLTALLIVVAVAVVLRRRKKHGSGTSAHRGNRDGT